MVTVNSKRVLMGAVAGGVVWIIWSALVDMGVLAGRYAIAQQQRSLLEAPRYGFFLPVYLLCLFVIAYILAWLYAGVRATYGPGPRTAAAVGAFVGFAVGFPGNFAAAAWAPIPRVIPFWWMVEMWVGAVLAALVAGWFYRDE